MNEINFDKGLVTCVSVMNDLFLSTAGFRGRTDNIPGKAMMAMIDSTDINVLSSLIGDEILQTVKRYCDNGVKEYTEEEIKDCIRSYVTSKENVRDLYYNSNSKPYSRFYNLVRRLNEGIGHALYGWSYNFGFDSKVEGYVRKYNIFSK